MLYIQNLNPGKGGFGAPYDSTLGVPDWVFYIGFILLVIISVKVFVAIRKSKADGRTESEREMDALKQLVAHKFDKKPRQIKGIK